VEERLPVHLSCGCVVDDETALHSFIVSTYPCIDPEGGEPHPVLLFVAHAAGDIHHVDDDRIRITFDDRFPGTVTLVFRKRPDARTISLIGPGDELPAQSLAKGALEVAQ